MMIVRSIYTIDDVVNGYSNVDELTEISGSRKLRHELSGSSVNSV